MEDRFSSMVDSFKDDRDGYLKKLNNLIAEECNAVDAQKKANGSAKQAYHEHICGIPTDSSFFYATAGLYPLLSLYTWAASINADHFVSI